MGNRRNQMDSKPIQINKGDITLLGRASGGEGKLSYVIAKSSQRKTEGKTRSTHVGIISKGGELLPDNLDGIEISEMTYPHARTVDLSRYKGSEIVIYRHRYASQQRVSGMMQTLKNHVSMKKKYGTFNIILHGLDAGLNWLLEKIPWYKRDLRPFTTLFFSKRAICSSLVAELYDKPFGITFGRKIRQVQPDDIDDYCGAHPQVFESIHDGVIK